jgi:hypothetical protein
MLAIVVSLFIMIFGGNMKKQITTALIVPTILLLLAGCGTAQVQDSQSQVIDESPSSSSPVPSPSGSGNRESSSSAPVAPAPVAPAPVAPAPVAPAPVAPAPVAPAPVAPNTQAASAAVRSLLYSHRIACQTSEEACTQSVIQNSYPGLLDFENGPTREYFEVESWTPTIATADTSTMQLDPGWTLGFVQCIDFKLDVNQPLPGDTYLVEFTYTDDGSKADVHVTILSGKAYFYLFPYVFC